MGITFEPTFDRLLVKRVEEGEQIRGGIIIPDNAKERPQEGIVKAVGPGKVLDNGVLRPIAFAVGDRVIFGKFSGTEIKIDGEEFLIVREDEIIAVSRAEGK